MLCHGYSPYTGKKCKARAVSKFTVNKKTGEFLDTRFCQMHQPGKISKKRCICPYCVYHRSKEKYAGINETKTVLSDASTSVSGSSTKSSAEEYCNNLLSK